MKKPEPATPATLKRWNALAESLGARGVELGAMFGMPCLKANGKAIGGLVGDALVFKLFGDAHADALKLDGAVLFDPSGMGRAMKDWVVVPAKHHAKWPTDAQ